MCPCFHQGNGCRGSDEPPLLSSDFVQYRGHVLSFRLTDIEFSVRMLKETNAARFRKGLQASRYVTPSPWTSSSVVMMSPRFIPMRNTIGCEKVAKPAAVVQASLHSPIGLASGREGR